MKQKISRNSTVARKYTTQVLRQKFIERIRWHAYKYNRIKYTHTAERERDDQFCSTDHLFIHYFGYRARALICIFFSLDYHCLPFVFRQDHFCSPTRFYRNVCTRKQFSIISSSSAPFTPLIRSSSVQLLLSIRVVFFISSTLHLIWLFVRVDAKSASDNQA